MIDGIKWIFKSAVQLAERFGLNERTVRRHLNEQVKQGLWNREKKEAKWGKQVYWYSVGEVDLKAALSDQTRQNARINRTKCPLLKPGHPHSGKHYQDPQAEQQNSQVRGK